MSPIYYFAYGSCANFRDFSHFLESHNCHNEYEKIGVARLDRHRLAFTRYSTTRNGGVLDIIPDENQNVYGILYQLTSNSLSKVNSREGFRSEYDPRNIYNRITVDVSINNTLISAYTYIVNHKEPDPIKPSLGYAKLVLDGFASEADMPSDYISLYTNLLKDTFNIAFNQPNPFNTLSCEAIVFDSSVALDNMGSDYVVVSSSIMKKLNLSINDTVAITFNNKVATLKVYDIEPRLEPGGSCSSPLQDFVCLTRLTRQKLGLNLSKRRSSVDSFSKIYENIIVRRDIHELENFY